ncbi:holin [Streptomyces indicus]|uniref:Phage r1t holin n=1 Tax=Streptomyces indicus TaxID=417292 RepID=A0A1G8W7P5_9ACTN|nr:holin [Streptomyces indicus]SDJ74321.1 phage r1t holin [Streptomyces indicus]
MATINSTGFWLATTERAVRTFAQTLIAALGLDAADVLALPWGRGLALAGIAAILSVVTSIATGTTGSSGPGITETANTVEGAAPQGLNR